MSKIVVRYPDSMIIGPVMILFGVKSLFVGIHLDNLIESFSVSIASICILSNGINILMGSLKKLFHIEAKNDNGKK